MKTIMKAFFFLEIKHGGEVRFKNLFFPYLSCRILKRKKGQMQKVAISNDKRQS